MLLQIKNLSTHYRIADGIVKAVDRVSLSVKENEVFGLAGESGCGKSTLIRTLMRLIPETAIVSADTLAYRDQPLLDLSDKEYRDRGIRAMGLSPGTGSCGAKYPWCPRVP